jgi:hypothetical protein
MTKKIQLLALSPLLAVAYWSFIPIMAYAQHPRNNPPRIDHHSPTVSFYIKIIVAAVIISLLIWGLNNNNNMVRERSPAEQLVIHFLESVRGQHFNHLATLFSQEYLEHQQLTTESLASKLAYLYEQLGSLHEYKLVDWSERKEMVDGKPSIYYELSYFCSYANDSTNESFIVRQPKNGSGIRITNVDIAPNRLVLNTPTTL